MYFLEQLKPVIDKIYVGKPCFVETKCWEQIAASEDKRALEEYLNGIIKNRTQRENKSKWTIRNEYKIISNNPNDKNC